MVGVSTDDELARYGKRGAMIQSKRRAIHAEEGPSGGLGHREDLFSSERHVVDFARMLLHCRDEFVVVAFAHRLATITGDLLVWHRDPPVSIDRPEAAQGSRRKSEG